jgi:hypothetical protein
MTRGDWDRCVVVLRASFPGRLRDDEWPDIWWHVLRSFTPRSVGNAVMRVIDRPTEHPPNLPQFLALVRSERSALQRDGDEPIAFIEPSPDDVWREVHGTDPPPPMPEAEAIARLKAMGFGNALEAGRADD